MKKEKAMIWTAAAVIILIIIVACAVIVKNRKEKEEEASAITAMYVTYGEDNHIFVSEQSGVFTIRFPEEIYDVNGNKIVKEQLVKGNIVKIYGNGIMAQSYPGQYNGVTRLVVTEEGTPEDAGKYQYIVDEIYTEPDPAEPPVMDVTYTTEMAVVTSMVNRGGYEWTYMDKDGTSNAVVADSLHVLHWGENLMDIKLPEPLMVTLNFSKEPQEVQVVRYEASLIGAEEIPEGEPVQIAQENGKFMIPAVEAGYVYSVTGIWENGRAEYGFLAEEAPTNE